MEIKLCKQLLVVYLKASLVHQDRRSKEQYPNLTSAGLGSLLRFKATLYQQINEL
jgi:hypothetical protein